MKLFGIGWPKTGTTSLRYCFELLGYSFYGYQPSLIGSLDQVLLIARRFDSFKDWPWNIYYKELDAAFPRSKFILTTRDSESWLKSYRNWVSIHTPSPTMKEVRKRIYGTPDPTDKQAVKRYEQHNAEVQRYFANRPNDLLVVNWKDGDGWEELCKFLGKPVPDRPFPHANKQRYI
jgi:hypothetical protein